MADTCAGPMGGGVFSRKLKVVSKKMLIKNSNLSLRLMAALYAIIGILHFIFPYKVMLILPLWMPQKYFLVISSGVIELILAALILYSPYRRISAGIIIIMLVIYLALVHIPMAIDFYFAKNPLLWAALLRLPLQGILISWTYQFLKK